MKAIFKIAIAATYIFSFASCDLNILPLSNVEENSFFENEKDVNTALMGCYNGMQGAMFYEWTLTELRSDNTRLQGATTTNEVNLQLVALDNGTMNSSNANVRSYWEAVYKNISNCNTVLKPENLAVITTPELRTQYEGEALFIRANHYFNLVRLFGPVFIVTENISIAESLKKERSTIDDVYRLIVSDLKRIVDDRLLPIDYVAAQKGRVTLTAAQSLLAKVYITLGQYDLAKPLLQEVITRKGEQLVPFQTIFDVNNEMNDEIIFTVRYQAGKMGIGSPFGNKFAPLNSGTLVILGNGDGQNHPTTEILNAYATGDVRPEVSFATGYIDPSKANPNIYYPYIKKYLSAVTSRYDGNSDWPVIRYADVLLLYAETLNETEGPTSNAFKYLNLIRKRAGVAAYISTDLTSRFQFREAVLKERRLELAFENQRWFDLLRSGNAVEAINKHIFEKEWDFYSTYQPAPQRLTEKYLLLPIPQSVIDCNPGVISQNPGY